MKAFVYTKYGTPDVLELKDVAKPCPKDNEVLIKIHATSVNASDWELLRGKPFYSRLFGLLRPKYNVLGSDVAGRVEAIGKDIEKFQLGDEVFGDILGSWGGFAEYVCVRENALVLKPVNMTFAEVAALPQAAEVALQGLRDKGQIKSGHTVLINGGGGGVGTFAVQIAKSLGAKVTAVDSTTKLDMMLTIGADQVIDYTQADFTQSGQLYDLILDVVGNRSILDLKRALSPKGSYVVVGGRILQALFLGTWVSMTGSKKMGVLGWKSNTNDLAYILELCEAGTVVPVIDRHYGLSEIPEALSYVGEGLVKGKVVITLDWCR